MKILPDFLIVGTMKSGTTSFSYYLNNHPEIYIHPKELHFFDNDNHYKKGLEWYENNFLNINNFRLIGEKTPTYSYLPSIPERIHNNLAEVKLIWIFRNPVDRTYSNYWHAVKNGVDHYSFEKALINEKKRMKKDYFLGYRYRSIYFRQINNFLKYFPKSQMYFLLFEDLIENPQRELKKVLKFLNLKENYEFKLSNEKKNVTYLPRSIQLQWLSFKIYSFLSKIRNFKVLSVAFNFLNYLNRKKKSGYKKMNPNTRELLKNYFKPYNEELANITGLNLEKWY